MELEKKTAKKKTEQLTLTKAEIAFLDATIELMREEEGRVESITINIEPQSLGIGKALVKGAKKVNKWVEKNGGWVALATAAADLVFGFTSNPSSVSQSQREILERFQIAANEGVSLDELIEFRRQLEGRRIPQDDCKSKNEYEG